METATAKTDDCCTSIEYKYIIGGVGVVVAVGGLYFAYKRDKREASATSAAVNVHANTADEVKPEKSVCAVKHENAVKPAGTKLDSFD